MFDRLFRSWEFAKLSWGILLNNKSLIIFPIISSIAVILVILSFILPLWGLGFFDHLRDVDPETHSHTFHNSALIIMFGLYFVSYFVIFFFNSALTACSLKILAGEEASVADGMAAAAKRLPQILGWAAISAVIGVALQMIENSHEQASKVVASILGTAWSVVTFFVVPVIVVEGVDPFEAIKRSTTILTETWGEGLAGQLSMGLISLLIGIPLYLVMILLITLGVSSHNPIMFGSMLVLAFSMLAVYCAASSAVHVIFRAVLYNYATGRTLPDDIDGGMFQSVFQPK